jgi:L-arabinokinase
LKLPSLIGAMYINVIFTSFFKVTALTPLTHAASSPNYAQVRAELGLGEEVRLLVFMFGGQSGGAHWKLGASNLPPGWKCVICHTSAPKEPATIPNNFVIAPPDAYLPDLVSHKSYAPIAILECKY